VADFPQIDLSGKSALVTGGVRGIGLAIARGLAQAGAKVAISGREAAYAQEIASKLAAETGRQTLGIGLDVRGVAECREAVEQVAAELGGLDILVNNAGNALTRAALDISEEEWDTLLDTHLKGTFFMSQAAARHMKERGGGVIVNISSVMGSVAEKMISPYCAAKGGINNLTRALALEWAGYGIRVVAVAPAYIETELNKDFISDPKIEQRLMSKTPLRRLGRPEEIAGTVAFLASGLAGYITGDTLMVDGGWTII
jgi:NAD(P)-dependent dehydrogenase (short-subunit alcohol dehydrogenase family)